MNTMNIMNQFKFQSDTEIEKAVIGALLIEPDAYLLVSDKLQPEDFYDSRNRIIYQTIMNLHEERKPIDILTVKDELERAGQSDEVGGPLYITDLCTEVLSSAHIEYHAMIVQQMSFARKLQSTNIRFITELSEGGDPYELYCKYQDKFLEIEKITESKGIKDNREVLAEVMREIAGQKKCDKIYSGIKALDQMSGGFSSGNVIIIAGRPSMGKSAFAISLIKNFAINQGLPVALFSLEMTNSENMKRMVSNICEIEGNKLDGGTLSPEEWSRIDSCKEKLCAAHIFWDETGRLSPSELRIKAINFKRLYGIKVIIVDYLQLMTARDTKGKNRAEVVGQISGELKALAKELEIPVIALAQLNRDVDNRIKNATDAEACKPQLSDLRESGAIEQDADLVLLLHRPEYYGIVTDKDGNSTIGLAEIIVAKNRHGDTGTVWSKFEGAFSKFSEIPE